MSFLDKCFARYINLDARPDRRAHMEKELKRVGIAGERMRGIPWQEFLEKLPGMKFRLEGMMKRPQKGAIGCHFSQVAVMEMALDEDQHAFVMEDDLVFCSDFQERLPIIEQFLDTHEWDVFWLGGTYHVNPPWWHGDNPSDPHMVAIGRDAELTENPRIVRTYGAFSTHAYIVNKKSIKKILRMFDERLHYSIGIDHLFISMQHLLFTYAFAPGCAIQYDNQSNIGNGMTIFSSFKKLGPHWFQDKMENFDPAKYDWAEARV